MVRNKEVFYLRLSNTQNSKKFQSDTKKVTLSKQVNIISVFKFLKYIYFLNKNLVSQFKKK